MEREQQILEGKQSRFQVRERPPVEVVLRRDGTANFFRVVRKPLFIPGKSLGARVQVFLRVFPVHHSSMGG